MHTATPDLRYQAVLQPQIAVAMDALMVPLLSAQANMSGSFNTTPETVGAVAVPALQVTMTSFRVGAQRKLSVSFCIMNPGLYKKELIPMATNRYNVPSTTV